MKQKILLLCLLFTGMLYTTAKANETEPNDSWNQANKLALNGSNNGDMNPTADVDWWKVTTNGDGAINLSLTSTDGRHIYFDLYDTLGTIALHTGTYTNGSTNYTVDGLAQGTYYIKIHCYYGTDTGRYTISNAFTPASVANDVEPNNSRAQAKILPLNSSKTGHIDYYFNNHRDSTDWYKVTTNADGRLRLTMSSANGQNVWAYLYDNDGVTVLGSAYTSGTAVLVNADGLAAGTYYIRVNTYYTTEYAPYTLSDSLFTPTIPNDSEPDSTRAQALTLPLNGNEKGHINYYYNHHRDSADWYKVTTNADGRLRLTMASANGQNVFANLYDNNATTLIASGYTSGSAVVVNTDGLAAGTYYIRVNTYYTTEFAPYTLSDSLFTPTIPNDTEPDSTKALALTLPLNGNAKGHVNYYYNNHKDSVDWYKLTTNADGRIRLTMASANGQNVFAYLFDNNGTTLIASGYTSGNAVVVNTDGLAAGTYYIRVNTYFTSEFAPYTLSDSLSTYNVNDIEPNKYAKQAKTLNSDQPNTGHVNFYYNNLKDSVDWFKINYTGNNGNMSVTLDVSGHYAGGDQNTYMQIYKDTAVAPLYSGYTTGTETANLSSLAKGYYYVKVFTYYTSGFSAYTITPNFVQTKAGIITSSYDTISNCSSNTITYSLSKSHSPYSVQLYRFGIKYGNAKHVNGKSVTFDSLPDGQYIATVYGDGATGSAKGKSDTISIAPPAPTNLNTTVIQSAQAKLNWTIVPCAAYYAIQYHGAGSTIWKTVYTNGNVGSLVIRKLKSSKTYNWTVAAVDSANGWSGMSVFADTATFKTLAAGALVADENNTEDNLSANGKLGNIILAVAPNPSISYFIIHYNTSAKSNVIANLYDVNGKAVWTSGTTTADVLNGKRVMVNQFGSGLYYLKIVDAQGAVLGTIKVAITK
ncbi:MAG: pre-peptidase C-terminal domain-containing protein [Parafilimonas sp.]